MHKAFKYRIYPTENQKKFLNQEFGAVRFVYNFFLARKESEYKNNKISLNYYDNCKFLTELKTMDGYGWLNASAAQTLICSLRNLDDAYQNFFDKRSNLPKFHSKKNKNHIQIPQSRAKIKNGKLFIPKLKTGIKIKFHQKLYNYTSCFISRVPSGKYYASFTCEVNIDPLPISPNSVGIDLGIKSLLIESNGNTVENPKYFKHLEPKLVFKQRQLSKKQKGSNKRNKQRIILAKQHEKIANKRKDLLHKLSRRLINENQVIIAENLAVKNMMKNHKLAKAISDVSWGELLRMIEYKAKWYGRTFYQIDRFFPSSKICNNCQFIKDKLSLKEREWVCPKCKSVLDRDLNAAKNIRDKGLSDLKNLSASCEADPSVCGTQPDIKQKSAEAFSSIFLISEKKLKKQEKSKRREISKKDSSHWNGANKSTDNKE